MNNENDGSTADKWIFEDLLNGDIELIIFDATDEKAVIDGESAAADLFPGWECIDLGSFAGEGEYRVYRAPDRREAA